jgi:2-haloacid dehalogenase
MPIEEPPVMSRAPFYTLLLVVGLATPSLSLHAATGHASIATPRFTAVAFDYFVLFDPNSVLPRIEQRFPGRGRELTSLWRTRQFEYSWLRSITGRYADFWTITRDALRASAQVLNLELTAESEMLLLDAYLHLAPWPDTVDALSALKRSGVRVIALSNFNPMMLRANAEHAKLLNFFDALVSTDENRTYKPDPRAYQLGIDRLQLAKSDILFAAFGAWDSAGAKSFGYTTYWVNRLNQPPEMLDTAPDETSTGLDGLLRFVLRGK